MISVIRIPHALNGNRILCLLAIWLPVSCVKPSADPSRENGQKIFIVCEKSVSNVTTGETCESYWESIKKLPDIAANQIPDDPQDKIVLGSDFYACGYYFSVVKLKKNQSDGLLYQFSNHDDEIVCDKVKLSRNSSGNQIFVSKDPVALPQVFKSKTFSMFAAKYKNDSKDTQTIPPK